MGCISSKTKAPDVEPYGGTVTPPPPETTQSSDDRKPRSETPQVGYHVGQEAVKVSRDAAVGDVQASHKKTSSNERQRTAEQRTSTDEVAEQPATSSVVSTGWFL